MAFGEPEEVGFRDADSRYAELKRQHEAGTIGDEEFDAQLKQLMVRDDEDRWWAKSRKTGKWHYHDGEAWVQDTPPGYGPSRTAQEDTPGRRSQSKQGEGLPPSPRILKRHRGVNRHLILAGLVGIAALTGAVAIATMLGEEVNQAPTYEPVEDDSGTLSVEVPSDWDELITVDSEGEKGRTSWSSFLGNGESAGPSITAVDDLYSWRNGAAGHQGVYLVASKELAQRHTDDQLVTSGPNDYSSSCETGTPQDFERPPYSGKILQWSNCGGDSEHTAITLAAAPENRECVIVLQIGGYLQNDEESIRQVLNTFETNCSDIA
jgi:hypothetical protein